jgi:hypothetical protein
VAGEDQRHPTDCGKQRQQHQSPTSPEMIAKKGHKQRGRHRTGQPGANHQTDLTRRESAPRQIQTEKYADQAGGERAQKRIYQQQTPVSQGTHQQQTGLQVKSMLSITMLP